MAHDTLIDKRKKDYFTLPNDFLNGYAKYVGLSGQAVYIALSRHADIQGKSFPSKKHLAIELGISERSVFNGINRLKEYNLIEIRQIKNKNGTFSSNEYILTDKKDWFKKLGQRWSNKKKKPTVGKI